LGCDGANSQVRKSLFGKEYPGETLHSQIIATNVSSPNFLPILKNFGGVGPNVVGLLRLP
jgi:2-polyprenyl-6-methoxyphenol hydroxylase-like FAD-dependent oxidoreductase